MAAGESRSWQCILGNFNFVLCLSGCIMPKIEYGYQMNPVSNEVVLQIISAESEVVSFQPGMLTAEG